MKAKDWFKKKLDSFKDDFEFRLESLILDVTENISKGMIDKNINRSELAGLLKVSPPAVTKILNGNSNFTLKTLLTLSEALDLDLSVEFKEKRTVAAGITATDVEYKTAQGFVVRGRPLRHFTGVASSGWNIPEEEMPLEEAA